MDNQVAFAESIDRLKESFLHAAAQGGNTQDCQALIEIGADINWKHNNGDTALLAACRRGHSETVALLLAHGADSNIVGSDSLSPLHVAASRGDADTLDALLDANTITTLKTKDGQTALDIAKAKGHESIYARLMRTRRPLAGSVRPTSTNRLFAETASARENLPSLSNTLSNTATALPSAASNAPAQEYVPSTRKKASNDRKAAEDERLPSSSKSANKSYTIMGDSPVASTTAGSLEEGIALRKILEAEIAKRKQYEAKLEVFVNQNKQLLEELSSSNQRLQTAEAQAEDLENELRRIKAAEGLVKRYGIEECEALEAELKASLGRVEKRKAILIRDQIESQKEQRLCVICQEKEKSVVLLPCRHMCLCDTCSLHDNLDMCPLCREGIVHKISVFA